MTMMFDLPKDLVEEILSRVPISSLGAVRSTCKRWNNLSKDRILCKAETKQQFFGFILKGFKVCSLRFDLNGIYNEYVVLSIKEIGELNQLKISRIFHCDGLLLLVTRSPKVYSYTLVVWNPYLGQTTWIKPSNNCHLSERYALGYDNNRNHKILRYSETKNCEIYDCKSKSWRILDVIPGSVFKFHKNIQSVSVKGNTYLFAGAEQIGEGVAETFLLCFDFTRERYGSCLPLPFHVGNKYDKVALYSIREEQLAVLITHYYTCEMEIWVTTKIEPDAVSWRNLFTVAITHFELQLQRFWGSFFIDQEKKLAVLFDREFYKDQFRHIAYFVGETGYLRKIDLGVEKINCDHVPVCSYAPSLVQINQGHITFGGKEKMEIIN